MSAEKEEEIKCIKMPFPPHLLWGGFPALCHSQEHTGRREVLVLLAGTPLGAQTRIPAVPAVLWQHCALGEQCHREDAPARRLQGRAARLSSAET